MVPGARPPVTWRETRRRLAADRERLREIAEPGTSIHALPAYVCVALHRYSHWCQARGWNLCARALWHLNLLLTGADISPASDLGPGLLVMHPYAVTVACNAGSRLTLGGLGGTGTGIARDDIGAGPGLPLLGDGVWLERGAMVLGPVRIGDRVRIGAGCTVVHDVAEGSEVLAHPVRVRQAQAAPEPSDAAG